MSLIKEVRLPALPKCKAVSTPLRIDGVLFMSATHLGHLSTDPVCFYNCNSEGWEVYDNAQTCHKQFIYLSLFFNILIS